MTAATGERGAERANARRIRVDPWTWQQKYGYTQAWAVDGARSLVFVAGQGPVSPDGALVGAGDFAAQARQTFDNLRAVLAAAGASMDDVVTTTTYLTDVTMACELGAVRSEYVGDEPPAGTVVGVTGLALPGMMIEVAAVAVR